MSSHDASDASENATQNSDPEKTESTGVDDASDSLWEPCAVGEKEVPNCITVAKYRQMKKWLRERQGAKDAQAAKVIHVVMKRSRGRQREEVSGAPKETTGKKRMEKEKIPKCGVSGVTRKKRECNAHHNDANVRVAAKAAQPNPVEKGADFQPNPFSFHETSGNSSRTSSPPCETQTLPMRDCAAMPFFERFPTQPQGGVGIQTSASNQTVSIGGAPLPNRRNGGATEMEPFPIYVRNPMSLPVESRSTQALEERVFNGVVCEDNPNQVIQGHSILPTCFSQNAQYSTGFTLIQPAVSPVHYVSPVYFYYPKVNTGMQCADGSYSSLIPACMFTPDNSSRTCNVLQSFPLL